jgi:hypothetical protein
MKLWKVHARNDVFIEAENYDELLYGLMALVDESADIADFMDGIARRCEIDSSAEIDADDPDQFIKDLIHYGYITKQEIH